MNTLWIVLTLTCLGLGIAGLVLLLARLLSYRQNSAGVDSGDFSIERYEPMAHLLDADDVEFFAQQPGVGSQALSEMKRDRRRIFRMYLRELTHDFRQLHAQARELAAAAPAQHADLVEGLLLQQVRFWKALGLIEFQLTLDSMGIGAVNPRYVLDLVGSLGDSVARASAGPRPVAI